MAVQAKPDGYHSVTPYLYVRGAARAIAFYKEAFGAEELFHLGAPDGKIMHAEIKIGDSTVMLADECPEYGAVSPETLGGSGVGLMIYVPDVDAAARQAVAAGAKEIWPVKDQFYGDRSGTFQDPFGHRWTLSTHVEDVPPEEIGRRFAEMFQQQG